MASTSFTENLGLCAWNASDRPKRIDFVNDNQTIDKKLGEHLLDTTIHLTEKEKELVLNPYTVMSYAGTGARQKTFTLDGEYTFAIIFQKFYPPMEVVDGITTKLRFALVGREFGSSSDVELTSNSIIVKQDEVANEDGIINCFNEEEGQYVAILFR